MGLLYDLILKTRALKRHEIDARSLEKTRQIISDYIGSVLARPTQQIIANIRNLCQNEKDKPQQGNVSQIIQDIGIIERDLHFLMDLAILEGLPQSQHIEQIKISEFIATIVRHSNIRFHLSARNARLLLETDANLLETLIIHLLDFLRRLAFSQLDLVVTTHVGKKVCLQFLAYQKNGSQVNKIYRVCSYQGLLRDPRWIQWAIVTEITRILQGKRPAIKKVKGKFLGISIILPDSLSVQEAMNHTQGSGGNKYVTLRLHTEKISTSL